MCISYPPRVLYYPWCSWVCSCAAANRAGMGMSAVLPEASALVKVKADCFPLWRGIAKLVRAFLAGPLEYEGHSEVVWEVYRQREQWAPSYALLAPVNVLECTWGSLWPHGDNLK